MDYSLRLSAGSIVRHLGRLGRLKSTYRLGGLVLYLGYLVKV